MASKICYTRGIHHPDTVCHMKIGLFYGSTTCYTEMAAEKIRDTIGAELVTLHNIKDTPLTDMAQYDALILGISTWDFGELQEDWATRWAEFDTPAQTAALQGKLVALYGLGDQLGYGEWFLDALGMLHQKVSACGARSIGYWPAEGYEFSASQAFTDDQQHFVGLALDEESQYSQSDERIQRWCEQILTEIAEQL